MPFDRELDFEHALIELLVDKCGWKDGVLHNPSEEDLIRNWAQILFENNRGIDQLNNCPLTDSEMQQILEQIRILHTPLKLNGFINGKSLSIKRDNPGDQLHLGKEVSLKIYDRNEIGGGSTRYQIAEQPKFKTPNPLQSDRRGDFTLLINGMPVIHVELKRSGVPVGAACNQIEKYTMEGVFRGLFSLVQVFVAMNPEETLYFANPGPDGMFNRDYYFHWANDKNITINDWREIASRLLSIPMAHQLIGFYTVADNTEGVLKVMRSYQCYAARAIGRVVSERDWSDKDQQKGGYVWHTTGSGKTMTSFKSAQLIANSQDADKVVFLMDRIELGTQSLKEYKGFAEDSEDIHGTDDTADLIARLKADKSDTLIVSSIQKMSRVKESPSNKMDLQQIRRKRIVFIIDEAHRSTFGYMLKDIKDTFPLALIFGFTGTPIGDANKKKLSTTADIFGPELHKYTIANAIVDKNVLGFDPYKVLTYQDQDLRSQVALHEAKATSEEEAIADPEKSKVFYHFMDSVPMAGYREESGEYIKGIEDYIPPSQYDRDEHREMVVRDILENWTRLSRNRKFHAILATSSIPEAMNYYHLIKARATNLKFTVLVDPNIDNDGNGSGSGNGWDKEKDLLEIIADYNAAFSMQFTIATHANFKKDVALRLAHKDPYLGIHNTPEKQLDLLIVVNQMLTGFDSKWINTLYLDKELRYESLIQAFSRTNRLFGPDKPFGVIRYYRKPHTMERNITEAVKYYSGNEPITIFADHLECNMNKLNSVFADIAQLFASSGIKDFEKLPDHLDERGKFAVLFKSLNNYLEAAKIQGFRWDELTRTFRQPDGSEHVVTLAFSEEIYLTLAQRYKELANGTGGSGGGGGQDLPFEVEGYLTRINTEVIDAKYMNSRFEKYLKALNSRSAEPEEFDRVKSELHRSFASLSREDQKFAMLFLDDLERGKAKLGPGKTLRDYIIEYKTRVQTEQLDKITDILGLDRGKLVAIMQDRVNESNLNVYGRFDALLSSVDKGKARVYFASLGQAGLTPPKLNMSIYNLLKEFVLSGGMDL